MKKLVQVQEIEGNNKIKDFLTRIGFTVLSIAKKNENGVDIWTTKDGKPYSVEVKKCRTTKRNSIQVPPVEPNRVNDDFILILHPSGYILFEPMSQHLKNCSPKGYRTLWR